MTLPPIYFYLPQPYFPHTLPATAAENWAGYGLGIYTWTLQTYFRLQAVGFPCQLVSSPPKEGIVLFHRQALQFRPLKPQSRLLLICLQADKQPCTVAHLHVVQNPTDSRSPHSYYLPHWSQPGLIPRNPERGDRFETIAYFGHACSLAPELKAPAWQYQLAALGLRWQPIINHNSWHDFCQLDCRWNDYSNIDAIVAIRSFHSEQTYLYKPATKLYNAWLAGVPALLGAESAYRAIGQANMNYLEVSSYSELLATLIRLKSSAAARQRLVCNGALSALQFLPEQITENWCQFLLNVAIPAWQRRCQRNRQQLFSRVKSFNFKLERATFQTQS
ncbi:hypothetical protein [Gloeocapsa sp. PCC 7428]|uniref:hypothetical protein n=1 Tax=Gloeocapsa sp. PCC 7428 TaxID=1173026 RepID=UPI00031DEB2A|nr:hypothetical protein [Gloeocapsa sp. PCC 7428]